MMHVQLQGKFGLSEIGLTLLDYLFSNMFIPFPAGRLV